MDALLRLYGYNRVELVPAFDEEGMLQNTDPKILLAQNISHLNPDTTSRAELLHIPGIGAVSAEAMTQSRKAQSVRDTAHLRSCGVVMKLALPDLSLGTTRQTTLALWNYSGVFKNTIFTVYVYMPPQMDYAVFSRRSCRHETGTYRCIRQISDPRCHHQAIFQFRTSLRQNPPLRGSFRGIFPIHLPALCPQGMRHADIRNRR